MSSTLKRTLYTLILLLVFPMSAIADIKIVIGTPSYKYNHRYSNHYSNNNHYKQNKHSRHSKYNKYNYPPYSYRNNNYKYSNPHKKYYSPSYRYQINKHHSYSYYNPYSNHRYNRGHQNGYKKGFYDGLNKRRRHHTSKH
jgi:hypothetical protein